jgi:hypothetical protein
MGGGVSLRSLTLEGSRFSAGDHVVYSRGLGAHLRGRSGGDGGTLRHPHPVSAFPALPAAELLHLSPKPRQDLVGRQQILPSLLAVIRLLNQP